MTDVKSNYTNNKLVGSEFDYTMRIINTPRFYALNVSGEDGDPVPPAGDAVIPPAGTKPQDDKQQEDKPVANVFKSDGLETVAIEGDENSYFINTDGSVVNNKGEVKYTKDAYDKILSDGNANDIPDTYSIVEVEGYDEAVYLNENKEFVNAKGDILLSKEEVADKYDFNNETDPFINGVKASNMFDNVDGIEFSEQGVTKVLNSAFEKGINKGKQDGIKELQKRFPKLPDIIRHMELFGTDFSKFEQLPDYSKIELTSDTAVSVLDSIVEDYYREKGLKPDPNYIQFLKNGDGYIDYVNGIKGELSDIVVRKKAAMDKTIADRRIAEQQKIDNYWGIEVDDSGNMIQLDAPNSVYNKMMKEGSIEVDGETFTIPQVIKSSISGQPKEYTRQEVFNWLYVKRPVEVDGEKINATGYELYLYQKNAKRKVDHDILDALTAFTGNDPTQLVKQSVTKHRKLNKTIATPKGANAEPRKQINVKPKMTIRQ